MIDGKALGQQLSAVVRDYVAAATQPLIERIASLENQIAGTKEVFATLESAPSFDQADIDRAVAAAVAALPPPVVHHGEDADPEVIRAMVADAVAKIPPAQNGKDVDMNEVSDRIQREVLNAVACIPVPKNGDPGKDADPEVIKELVAGAVAAQMVDVRAGVKLDEKMLRDDLMTLMKMIPVPKDGKDADPEAVKAMVAEAVAAMPVPKDGKDADESVVRAMVNSAVETAVSSIPAPKDGHTPTADEIAAVVKDAVAALPTPKDGADADPEKTAALVEKTVNEQMIGLFQQVSEFSQGVLADQINAEVRSQVNAIPKPKDGKDVDEDVVRQMVDESVTKAVASIELPTPMDGHTPTEAEIKAVVEKVVALIPAPKDGAPADPTETAALVDRVVAEHMVDAHKTLSEYVDVVVTQNVAGLPVPKDGESVSPEEVKRMVDIAVSAASMHPHEVKEWVGELVAALPKPKDGADADPAQIRSVVSDVVAENLDTIIELVVEKVPPAEPGQNGKDVDVEQVRSLVADQVKLAVAELPAPKAGEPGKDADIDEVLERVMPEAIKAIDVAVDVAMATVPTAESVAMLIESEQTRALLNFERRAQDVLRSAIDNIPPPKDGKDALELENFDVEHVGDGVVFMTFTRGDLKKEFKLRIPCFSDKGVYVPDTKYVSGDGVTWGGSYFLAQVNDPQGKPGETKDWRCAVKRGRDGRDLRPEGPKNIPVVKLDKGDKK